jgi:hypothetical protein
MFIKPKMSDNPEHNKKRSIEKERALSVWMIQNSTMIALPTEEMKIKLFWKFPES